MQGIKLTKDHTKLAEMIENGVILKEELLLNHYQSNILTPYIGGGALNSKIKPLIKCASWEKDDYLLLCSDGLTKMLNENEIFTIIGKKGHQKGKGKNILGEEKRLKNICNQLVRQANHNGGTDNITTILIKNEMV